MQRADADRSYVIHRWLEYEGELRAGLLRVLLITAFYAVELFTFLTADQVNETAQQFHRQATYLSAAWLLVSLVALIAIGRQWLPAGLKYFTCGFDVALLTSVAWFGSGANSPLVILYALLIVMAGLRGSLPLIWFATIGATIGYVALLNLPEPPLQRTEDAIAARHVKPIAVCVVVLAIVASGVVTGQLVRMVRQVVSEVYLRSLRDATSDGTSNATGDATSHATSDALQEPKL